MRWTDVYEIAASLEVANPEADNVNLRFTDLHQWVLALPGFNDDPSRSNEKILEAIQAAWIEELLECQAVLQDRLAQSSSLEGELPELIKASWKQARRSLAVMARIKDLPEDCPFSLDALLDREA